MPDSLKTVAVAFVKKRSVPSECHDGEKKDEWHSQCEKPRLANATTRGKGRSGIHATLDYFPRMPFPLKTVAVAFVKKRTASGECHDGVKKDEWHSQREKPCLANAATE